MTEQTQLTAAQIQALETADLLDINMDEVPDAPDFCNPPTGIYLVDLKISQGTYEKKIYKDKEPTGETEEEFKFNINCVIKDLLDVQETDLDEGEELPKVQDRFSNGYFGKSGLQGLIGDMRAVAKHLQVTNARALLETLSENPVECVVAVKRTKRTKDGVTYLGVKFESVAVNA